MQRVLEAIGPRKLCRASVRAPASASAISPAITIGPADSTPSQSAVAVDSSGAAYIAWQVPTPALTNTLIDFCKVSSGASGCTPVAIPVPAGGLFFDPPTVMLSGGDIYVFEEVDGSTSAQDGLDAWVSSNGGSSFVEDPYAISNLGEETANPVIPLPGGNIGNGSVSPTGNPQFQVNSLGSPVQYSAATGTIAGCHAQPLAQQLQHRQPRRAVRLPADRFARHSRGVRGDRGRALPVGHGTRVRLRPAGGEHHGRRDQSQHRRRGQPLATARRDRLRHRR